MPPMWGSAEFGSDLRHLVGNKRPLSSGIAHDCAKLDPPPIPARHNGTMSEDPAEHGTVHSKSWFERLGEIFSGEVRSREELIEELRNARRNGLVDADTLAMLEGAMQVSELSVSDVMVPRAQIATISVESSLPEILNTVVETGHSRFPVHGEHRDQVLGILLAKDLLKCFADQSLPCDIRGMLRPVAMVPESKPLNVLLKEFKDRRYHMALVVDEYGGVAGLVTIEDVLEEIVGEIDDEHDAADIPQIHILALPDGRFQVEALTPIDEFNTHFDARFDEDEYDTIGGVVVASVGQVPDRGDIIHTGGFEFEILDADNRRVSRLAVRRASEAASEADS
jgi:magnesium and cobalt transporter